MVAQVAVQAVAQAGAAGARVAATTGKAGATVASSASKTAKATRSAGKAAGSAARTGRGAARAGSRTAGRAHRLQKGAAKGARNNDLRRLRKQLGGDGNRRGKHRPSGGSRPARSGQGNRDDPVTQLTDTDQQARRTVAGATGAVRMVGRVVRPIRGLRRATFRQIKLAKRRVGQDEASATSRRRWLIGIVLVSILGAAMSAPLMMPSFSSGTAGSGNGVTVTNATAIADALAEAGVPREYADDFAATASLGIDPRLVAAVAWQESIHFKADVIACRQDSPKGARGIMQFMPGTAREMEVDPCVPEQAIPGGARYLLKQYEKFRSWDLALAAYNAGPRDVESCRCVPTNGETEDYVPKVNEKWNEYKRTVPEPRLDSSGSRGANPGGPKGSVERFTDPRITSTMQAFLDQAVPMFGRSRWIGCWRPGATDGSDGEHPLGRACDFAMSAPLNTHPTPEYLEHGWRFACWAIQNSENLKVRYVVWQHQIWQDSSGRTNPDRRCVGNRAGEGWRPYTRYDPCNPSRAECLRLQHYDHVHVSVN